MRELRKVTSATLIVKTFYFKIILIFSNTVYNAFLKNQHLVFKVDRLQIIVLAVAKIYTYVSQLFISRIPKMRAIPQLVCLGTG